MNLTTVILAGGRLGPEWKAGSDLTFRSELPIRDRRMVDVVIEAVAAWGQPVIVGGPPALATVEAGASFIESLSRGLSQVTTEQFLLVTADLPFLTAEAVAGFLDGCDAEAMLNYPIIPVDRCEAAYPGMPRTTLKLAEGRFTGGNMSLMRTDLMRRELPKMEEAYALRKRPLALAAMVGYGTLARVLLGQWMPALVPIRSLEAAVTRMLGAQVRGIVVDSPAIGADIDTPEQYAQAQKLIALSPTAK